MLNIILFVIIPIALLLAGGASLIRRKHAGDPDSRLRCGKMATGFFGSAGIIWLVYILGSLLQLVAIVVAIAWYLKWLLWGRSSVWFLRMVLDRNVR